MVEALRHLREWYLMYRFFRANPFKAAKWAFESVVLERRGSVMSCKPEMEV